MSTLWLIFKSAKVIKGTYRWVDKSCIKSVTYSNIVIAFFTNTIGFFQVLVCRNYRGDVDMSEIEHFMTLLMDKEEEGTLSPILAHGGVRFMWIKHNNLYCIFTVYNMRYVPKQLVTTWYYAFLCTTLAFNFDPPIQVLSFCD